MNQLIINYLFLLLAFVYAPWSHSESVKQRGIITFPDKQSISVEIADTEAQRQYGLMHRAQLNPNSGMLFVYSDQALRAVWMKNTLIALDIIFMSDSGKIVSMLPNLSPCKTEPCNVYTSKFDARYMLEVNAGFIAEHNIAIGQDVLIDYPPENPKAGE